jgi:hypothetical protein
MGEEVKKRTQTKWSRRNKKGTRKLIERGRRKMEGRGELTATPRPPLIGRIHKIQNIITSRVLPKLG